MPKKFDMVEQGICMTKSFISGQILVHPKTAPGSCDGSFFLGIPSGFLILYCMKRMLSKECYLIVAPEARLLASSRFFFRKG
mmetsp:Transcript_17181/g.47300  ORF Transcript_17181/g.47300 Transcript_17181/m.47300 type:complete len:82 (+) Transcript_17181:42-287(+)